MAKDSFASGCLFWIVVGIVGSTVQDCFGDEEKSDNDKDSIGVVVSNDSGETEVSGFDNDYSRFIEKQIWRYVEGIKQVNYVKKVAKNPNKNFYKIEVEVDIQGITGIQHGYVYVYEDGIIERVSMLNDYEIKDKELREKGQRMYEESERLYQ